MDRQALRVAVPEAPDFRTKIGISHERIVERHATIVVYPIDGAVVILAILCRVCL
jgi:hypothetical protein